MATHADCTLRDRNSGVNNCIKASMAVDELNTTYIFDALLSVCAVLAVLATTIFFLLRRMVATPLGQLEESFSKGGNGRSDGEGGHLIKG